MWREIQLVQSTMVSFVSLFFLTPLFVACSLEPVVLYIVCVQWGDKFVPFSLFTTLA